MNGDEGVLVVAGQGQVGLPIAMRAVSTGFTVVGVDLDAVRVWSLKDGNSYVDDVPDGELRWALNSGRYLPTDRYDDADGFDAAIIAVPAPLRGTVANLSCIEAAAGGLAPHLRAGATVVLESTTCPGTTEELVVPLLERGSGLVAGTDFFAGYSPHRTEPGNARWTLVNTPKVVSGIDADSLAAVSDLYGRLVETTIPVSSPRVAELTTLLENAFRHVNIALVNEIAMFAHQLDIDVWEAIEAAGSKPFGYLPFTPGPGAGGHCLPVDPSRLTWHARHDPDRDFRFVALANDINDRMPEYVLYRLAGALGRDRKQLAGATIVLLGLAHRANTGELTESPALTLIDLLHERGATVHVVDSHVEPHRCPPGVKLVELSEQHLRDADGVVLLTDHEDIDYPMVESSARWVLDTRHRLRGDRVEHL
ncbi:UDP-N-acetyl-D-glucosamine dehydrogenase [Prauserella marina]|uniref:UDP-N-acetyl-D-mannosaminuronic acid dehydrogenase/UDP-N-acetyl-D-glucosamine dehydrogenase n=1 Tax=Prauserella marina TaxID=530584 RepID=A0A222VZH4_9PSEU|nr:nucleotide sugar dehydrogenase [Prauserella marina]ASR39346.1 UDP-N-acetyl-D-glucosamine dehydrogenase [Prauserella marina]PWV77099.1 UDP-N-acetyl-D-mannosaminuronic acid dehydrogenase/UDP-N-acetyl-D-glucosamine dehydrogenase [Prauserella marina]SDD04405.1 UDP-N-acetyl-D-mannosaminuronic acid dehydrogenase/UDP-N-acetyl-D-glucosamine dehydrogenase [Prauserella marina]